MDSEMPAALFVRVNSHFLDGNGPYVRFIHDGKLQFCKPNRLGVCNQFRRREDRRIQLIVKRIVREVWVLWFHSCAFE
jgi:hypothetical protein